MKTYPELAAEGMKKTLFVERKLLTEDDNEYEYKISYLPGDFYLYIALEDFKGTREEETVRIKSGSDAAKAYQKFFKENEYKYNEAGIYSFICVGRNSSEAQDFAEGMSSELGITYNDNKSVCFGLQVDDESTNSVKSKSDKYFKNYDGFIKAFNAVQKAAQSKKIENIEKVFANYAKFKKKLSSPSEEFAEFIEETWVWAYDTESLYITIDYKLNDDLEFSNTANVEEW